MLGCCGRWRLADHRQSRSVLILAQNWICFADNSLLGLTALQRGDIGAVPTDYAVKQRRVLRRLWGRRRVGAECWDPFVAERTEKR